MKSDKIVGVIALLIVVAGILLALAYGKTASVRTVLSFAFAIVVAVNAVLEFYKGPNKAILKAFLAALQILAIVLSTWAAS